MSFSKLLFAGIYPSTTRSYSFYEVQRAMKNAFGVDDATYWCRFSNGKQLLFQVKILFYFHCLSGIPISISSSSYTV